MAEFTNEEFHGHIRTYVKIEPDEKIKLCRCSKSTTYPFCDGNHKELESTVGPVFIEVISKSEE
jgi:CDGSH-type Zn-finger protein